MDKGIMDHLYVALVHFPVMNRRQQAIGSALTTIDLHDIARAARTFGAKGVYVVTPFEDQADLADQVIRHWTHGAGSTLNPSRKQALELIRVVDSIDTAVEDIRKRDNRPVVTIATSAKRDENCITIDALKQRHDCTASHVLVLGTAWGLADEARAACDFQLEPITGKGDYNHLSVRSAASIYLDRLTNG